MLSAPCCVPQEGLVTGDDCCRCHAWGWSICSAHAERATPGAVIFASAPSAPSWTRDGARCAPCFCRVLGLGYCFVDVLGARACPLGPPALVKGPGQARSRWSVGALQLIGAAYPPWQPRCRCVDGVETRGRRCRRDGVRAATRTARAPSVRVRSLRKSRELQLSSFRSRRPRRLSYLCVACFCFQTLLFTVKNQNTEEDSALWTVESLKDSKFWYAIRES